MPKPLLIALLFIFSSLYTKSQDLAYHQTSFTSSDTYVTNKNQTVYICSGQYAYAYHSISDCPGLNNCKGSVVYTDENTAVYSYRRAPCCRCWSSVAGNCKDDNLTGGGGGGGGDGDLATIGAVILVGSAIILSNDIYFYPTLSIKNGQKNYHQEKSFGWSFGFRKTFPKSAFEYGVSLVNDQWGYHLNYVHQIFKSKMPENVTVYTGPSINYIDDFGYGGVIGGRYQLLKRLSVDLRYELTSQTNNIKLGLIFTYQRKYFWQR